MDKVSVVRPLAGVRVLELARTLAGAYCGKLFAVWGAEVTAVDAPELLPHEWEFLYANKEWAAAACSSELVQAIDAVDVLLTDFGVDDFRLATGVDLLGAGTAFPSTVVVSVTPFGLAGPYANLEATDLTVAAASGFMSLNGTPSGPPRSAPGHILEYTIGANAFVAALAALHRQGATNRGSFVEVAGIEAAASLVPFLRTAYSGQRLRRSGGPSGTTLFKCSDGYITLNAGAERSWPGVLMVLGIGDDDVPERLKSEEGRANKEDLRQFLQPYVERRGVVELFHALSEVGVVVGILHHPRDLLENEQLNARRFFSVVHSAVVGAFCLPGPGAIAEGFCSAAPQAAPVRTAGGHLAFRPRDRAAGSPPTPQQPALAGVRVLDLTHAWMGPHATLLLADLGAEIVKVESIRHPDPWRVGAGPTAKIAGLPEAPKSAHPWNLSPLFNAVNMNKRSVILELDTPEGRELFLRLVERFDLVVENFTPRVLENLGLTFEELRKANPRIVLVSASGFGATGPWRNYRANGATTEANAGWDALFEAEPGSPPMMLGAMQADAICGVQLAALCLLALRVRNTTGAAQRVDASMLEMAVSLIGEEVVRASAAERPRSTASLAPTGLRGVFRTAGDDSWIAVEIRNERDWRALLSVVDDPMLASPDVPPTRSRLFDGDRVRCRLAQWILTRDNSDIVKQLRAEHVPACPVLATDEVLNDPHFRSRSWFRVLTHPDAGTHDYNGPPWRIAGAVPNYLLPPPRMGEHSLEVLQHDLGICEVHYEALVKQGITGSLLHFAKGVSEP